MPAVRTLLNHMTIEISLSLVHMMSGLVLERISIPEGEKVVRLPVPELGHIDRRIPTNRLMHPFRTWFPGVLSAVLLLRG